MLNLFLHQRGGGYSATLIKCGIIVLIYPFFFLLCFFILFLLYVFSFFFHFVFFSLHFYLFVLQMSFVLLFFFLFILIKDNIFLFIYTRLLLRTYLVGYSSRETKLLFFSEYPHRVQTNNFSAIGAWNMCSKNFRGSVWTCYKACCR